MGQGFRTIDISRGVRGLHVHGIHADAFGPGDSKSIVSDSGRVAASVCSNPVVANMNDFDTRQLLRKTPGERA